MITDLINISIDVTDPMIVDWHGERSTLDMSDTLSKFNGTVIYCVNNSTIVFCYENRVFVTPYTRKGMKVILEADGRRENMYVPFSNGDYPVALKERWYSLRAMAREMDYIDYEADCREWCKEHDIDAIDDEVLKRCFRMPRTGVPVHHNYWDSKYFPIGHDEYVVDCTVVDVLGRFCYNNGRVVFMAHDGHTYVAKGYWVIKILEAAGYKKAGLFVPFSNCERITDERLAAQWDAIA